MKDHVREYVPLRQKVLPSFGDVQAQPDGVGFGALNVMISALILLGVPGYLLDRWLGTNWIVAIALILGMALALTIVWFRYGTGRRAHDETPGDVAVASARAARQNPKTTEDQG